MSNKRLKKKMGRRRNGEGSVVSRSDGRFQASQMINGKRIYFYSWDETECYKWLDEIKVRRIFRWSLCFRLIVPIYTKTLI